MCRGKDSDGTQCICIRCMETHEVEGKLLCKSCGHIKSAHPALKSGVGNFIRNFRDAGKLSDSSSGSSSSVGKSSKGSVSIEEAEAETNAGLRKKCLSKTDTESPPAKKRRSSKWGKMQQCREAKCRRTWAILERILADFGEVLEGQEDQRTEPLFSALFWEPEQKCIPDAHRTAVGPRILMSAKTVPHENLRQEMRETNARCFCASTSKCAGGSANTTDHIKVFWTTKLQVHQMLCNAAVMRPRGSERKRVSDVAATTGPISMPRQKITGLATADGISMAARQRNEASQGNGGAVRVAVFGQCDSVYTQVWLEIAWISQ
ncbi:hypothetical protein B0H17DRAFT_1138294 [Mycena rosella]|uniref:Uncharacterized protein n=1 Tax=Mycena rosella TaxID=1033263 RepID=A0AAD7D6W6_MYCRO|nr:hypothetical protein B0H17DRAFT_1138294 [Mycena rosella]